MKVLLVGNVANNSYNNAKLLRRKGIEADVLCYDYTHVMGQPEWEDAEFEGQVDEFNPDWKKVDLNGFKRPSWFIQTSILRTIRQNDKSKEKIRKTSFVLYLILKIEQVGRRANTEIEKYRKRNEPSFKIGLGLYSGWKKVIRMIFQFLKKHCTVFYLSKTDKTIIKTLCQEFQDAFEKRQDQLIFEDIYPYIVHEEFFQAYFKKYDIIHACATDPIYPMLVSPGKPYVTFEHGTMRDIPFEDSARGRLLSLAYRKARKVIITNSDVLSSAKKLKVDNYVFIPHPIDETQYYPRKTPLFDELRNKYNVDLVIFCPVRHDWEVKGTDIHIRAFARYIKNTGRKVLLMLAAWGNEVTRSKALIQELGIEKNVAWFSTLSKMKLIKHINASDVILDQLVYPCLSGIAPGGMACAKPVIAAFKHETCQWCFDEPPPVLSAFTEEEVLAHLERLLEDKELRKKIGRKSREWMLKYHGWELVADRLIKVYREALS